MERTTHKNRRQRNDGATQRQACGTVTQDMVRNIGRGLGQEADCRSRCDIISALSIHIGRDSLSSRRVSVYKLAPSLANVELTGRFSVIAGELSLGIAVALQGERLVPEARSAEKPNGRMGTG